MPTPINPVHNLFCDISDLFHDISHLGCGGSGGSGGSGGASLGSGGGSLCDIVSDSHNVVCDIVGIINDIGHPTPSDVRLKDDIVPLESLANGLGLYRFRYKGNDQKYVGVMAQEVAETNPEAVVCGQDGYLRVDYENLGLRMMTWEDWIAKKQAH